MSTDADSRTQGRAGRAVRRGAVAILIAVGCLSWSVIAQPAASAGAAAAKDPVPVPKVEGPILPTSGISFVASTTFPLSQVGYEESEFFLSGTATAYKSSTPLTKNGRWHVMPATTAPYKTRVVVYRPINPKRFDGTVVVEWLNVTAGIDAPAAWLSSHIQMIRDGMAYVGVDAQAGGINGQAGSIASQDLAGGLKQVDPARYGSLHHPGDSLLLQHLPAGRSGDPSGRSRTARRTPAEAGPGPRRVTVRLPARDVHRRASTAVPRHLRRLLRLQPGRRRCRPLAGPAGHHHHPGPDVHPHGPPRAGLPVRDRSRRARPRIPAGAPAAHPIHPRMGGGRLRPRRHLRPALFAFGQRERRRRHRCLPVDARPAGRPDPRHRRL